MTGPTTDWSARAAALCAIADAVAEPGAPVLLLRDERGKKVRAGWSELPTLRGLAESDPQRLCTLPFAVTVAADVLALDCDTPEAVAAAEQIAQWCRDAGANPVVVRSGRDGHTHLWCRTENPALHRAAVLHAAAAGADVRTGARMRPPGSAHPSSGQVHVEGGLEHAAAVLGAPRIPGVHITELDTATARAEGRARRRASTSGEGGGRVISIAERAAGRLAAQTLSAHTLAVLRSGDGDTDRSATFQRILVGMVNRGWDIDTAWSALTVRSHEGAAKLLERLERHGEEAARAYLEHSWDSATRWVAANPPRGCDPIDAEAICELVNEADTHRWAGEAGAAAWMVLHTLCVIGFRGPGVVLGASERELAERCALSRTSVHRALGTLVNSGWITCLETGRGPVASTWQLEVGDRERRDASRVEDPLPHPPTLNNSQWGCVENGLSTRAGADAFRRTALGVNGFRVLRALLLWGDATTATLAERLGLHPGTIGRVLHRCKDAGLAERCSDGTWALLTHGTAGPEPAEDAAGGEERPPLELSRAALVCDPSRLSAVAVAAGTVGALMRARALHAAERETYARSAAYAAATAKLKRGLPAASAA